MTIAMCYLSPEGVVIGADSTSSLHMTDGFHYFNYNQKILEVGEDSTVGFVTWGLGGLGEHSYRSQVALLADELRCAPVKNIEELANKWIDRIWPIYQSTLANSLSQDFNHLRALDGTSPFDPKSIPSTPGMRTEQEETQYLNLLNNLSAGFCFAGYLPPERKVEAWVVILSPLGPKPVATEASGVPFWGAPNMIKRLLFGHDARLRGAILDSGKWAGTPNELDTLLGAYTLLHPTLPIRDAIDFVHACIQSTIKAFKFSPHSQICGGPIEIAVITTDRKFRWVRHKDWDAAIREGAET